MTHLWRAAVLGSVAWVSVGCNSSTPEPVSMEIPSAKLRLTIVRMATDPFLSRHVLTLKVQGEGRCESSTELFPNTGHVSRRNIFLASKGMIYIVGQFDARIINPVDCQTKLSEFQHLDRDVVFIGSFDEDKEHGWTYYSAAQRRELPFEKR
ncbi:MAG: hypothetical protein HP494_14215 [Nitrospira sp.]|nr:hypothetical protein [Nitrospira sp.]